MSDRVHQTHAPPSHSFPGSFEHSWSCARFDGMLRSRDVPGHVRRELEARAHFDWLATLAEEAETVCPWDDDNSVLSDYYSDSCSEDD